jgi:capsular polysaccharide biosynthesis protein
VADFCLKFAKYQSVVAIILAERGGGKNKNASKFYLNINSVKSYPDINVFDDILIQLLFFLEIIHRPVFI